MEIDAFFLSNSTETRAGLMYVLGGGWMRTWPPDGQYPYQKSLGVTALVRVGWNETNEEHTVLVKVEGPDGEQIGQLVKGGFNIGRDPEISRGMSQLITLSGMAPISLPAPAIYEVVLLIDDEPVKRIQFEAREKHPRAQPAD